MGSWAIVILNRFWNWCDEKFQISFKELDSRVDTEIVDKSRKKLFRINSNCFILDFIRKSIRIISIWDQIKNW